MSKFICLIFTFFILKLSFGQTVVFDSGNKELSPSKSFGPNLKRYNHWILGYSNVLPYSKNGYYKINSIKSFQINLLRREKFKISKLFSTGYDLGLNYRSVFLNDENFENSLSPKITKIIRGSLVSTLFLRINFDINRGNKLGSFFDFGIMPEYFFASKASINFNSNSSGFTRGKISYYGLNELSKINTAFFLRLGMERVNFVFKMELLDELKKKNNYFIVTKNISPLSLGIELNLKK